MRLVQALRNDGPPVPGVLLLVLLVFIAILIMTSRVTNDPWLENEIYKEV